MNCFKYSSCVNRGLRCLTCQAIATDKTPYPKYLTKDDERYRLTKLLVNKNRDFNLSNKTIDDIVDYLVENGVRVEEV